MRVLVTWMCVLTILVSTGSTTLAQDSLVTLDFKETDIRDVLRTLSYQQSINIVADADVVGPVTIRLVDVSLEEALDLLVTSYGWRLERRDNVYHVRSEANRPLFVETSEGRFNIRSSGASLSQVLLALGESAGKSIVPASTTSTSVYINLTGVTFEEALGALLPSDEFTWRQDGGIHFIDAVRTPLPENSVGEQSTRGAAQQISILPDEAGMLSVYGIDVPLRELLYRLAEEGDMGLILHPELGGQVTLRWDHAKPSDLISHTARLGGYTARSIEPGVWWVGPAEAERQLFSPEQEQISVQQESATEEVLASAPQPGAHMMQVADGLVWLSAREARARDILLDLSDRAGLSVSFPADVGSVVTIQLEGVPVDQALAWVAESAGLKATQDGQLWKLEPSYQPTSVQMENGRVMIRAYEADVRAVLSELAWMGNKDVVVDPDVQGLVTLVVHEQSWQTAFEMTVAAAGLHLHEELGAVYISPEDEPGKERRVGGADPDTSALEVQDGQFVQMHHGQVSLRAEEADVRKVLAELAWVGRRDVVIDPQVQGEATLLIHDQPWETALSMVTRVAKLEALEEDGVLYIHPSTAMPVDEQIRIAQSDLPQGVQYLEVESGKVSVYLRNVPLDELLVALQRRLVDGEGWVPIGADRDVSATAISGLATDLPLAMALAVLLEPYNLELVEQAEGYRIRRKEPKRPYQVTDVRGLISVTADRAPLADVVLEVGRRTGMTLLLPNNLTAQVSMEIHALPPTAALEALLTPSGYTLEAADIQDAGVYHVVPPDTRPVRVMVSEAGVSVVAANADLSQVLSEIARISGANIVVEASAAPRLNVTLTDMPLPSLLEALTKPYGWKVDDHGDYVLAGPDNAQYVQAVAQPAVGRLSDGIRYLEITENGIRAEFANARLTDLVQDIAQLGGPRFTVDRELQNERVSGVIQGTEVSASVFQFLRQAGYTLFHADTRTFVRSMRSNQPLIHMGEDGLFYLDIAGGDLASLIRDLANKAGYGIVLYPHVHGNVGSMQLYAVTFETALDTVLRGTTFAFSESEGTYYVGEAVSVRPDSPELTEVRIIPLRHIQPSELTSMLPASIPAQSIRAVPGQNAIAAFGGERLLSAIEEFAASVDIPHAGVAPQLLALRHVTADEVATVLARVFPAQSFQLLQSQNALLLTGSDQVNERIVDYVKALDVPELAVRSAVLPLQNLRAEDAKRLLPSAIDTSRILVIDEQNALAVSGRDEFIEQVRAYLADIDIKTPQILFEVIIVEVNDRESLQYGFNGASSDGSLKFDLGTSNPFTLALGPTSLADATLTATLSTLVQAGKAKLLANPRLTTLSGLEASFTVLTTSRYWTPQVQSDNNDPGGTGNVVQSFRTIETGIRLRLKPWVSAAGDITIELQPEISDSAGTSSGSSLPSTNDRAVQTTVRVRDGETIVIGGLIQRTEHRDVSKVPILGDIPLLGMLFRSENISETETEFIIAITPKLLDV